MKLSYMKDLIIDAEMPIVVDSEIQPKPRWMTFGFYQELFIYFWFCSIIGHYLEIAWAYINHWITGKPLWQPMMSTIMPLALPYGLGAIAVILLTWPLLKNHKVNPVKILILNIFVTGAIEYFCAMLIVIIMGTNNFWNYSDQPFNLNGYTCLEASVIFGVVATLYLYYIYPFFKKSIDKFKKKQLSWVFWVLFVTYLVDLTYSLIK